MNTEARQHLLGEQTFLQRQLADTPQAARLTRMSAEARLRLVAAELAALPLNERTPARARLTFDGLPVIGSHGIFADFGMRAVSSFADAVASVAASLAAPLAAMGPIPNRDRNQLLITNTAVGSFGFELEEYRTEQLSLEDQSPIAIALDRTQALLLGTMGNDEDLADIASETDPRALEKIRAFLKVLADGDAVCALQYGGKGLRFTDVGQVRSSLARLGADNLRETKEHLRGKFLGVLPNSRTFEFERDSGGQIVRGKVSTGILVIDEINAHLQEPVQIEVTTTQVGNGRPRYLLMQLPSWIGAIPS